MHQLEAPTALQTSLMANINRDPKKAKRPFAMEDFCFFLSNEDRNIPSAEFGAAAMALIQKKIFPHWGLFAYKDLKEAAAGPPPEVLALMSHDIMVLAPRIVDKDLQGMMIALESASGQLRSLKSPCKKTVLLRVPEFQGKYYCQENVSLPLAMVWSDN